MLPAGEIPAPEQIRDLLVELTHLMLEELQFLERHLDQPPIDRVELGASA